MIINLYTIPYMEQSPNNMMNSMMSTNMISMMSMKNDVTASQIIFGIIVMNFMALLPYIKSYMMKHINNYINKNKAKIEKMVNIKNTNIDEKREIISSIKLVRGDNNDISLVFDSINFYVIHNNNAKFLHYKKDFTVINDEIFKINETVYCKVSNDIASDKDETNYIIELFSYDLKLSELKHFIDEMKKQYMHEQNNKLGQQKFYFDEKHVTLPLDDSKNIRFDMAPKNLNFIMTPFYTNKSLSNIFGHHLQNVKERVDMFLNNKEWYKEKGIPYTLGIMLHGPPGTGKTSLIKAISKDSKRHVFNIKFNKDTTQTQLRDLFFNESVSILQNGRSERFNIPINERIYVIEDIDCLTDVLNERVKVNNTTDNDDINIKDNGEEDNDINSKDNGDITNTHTNISNYNSDGYDGMNPVRGGYMNFGIDRQNKDNLAYCGEISSNYASFNKTNAPQPICNDTMGGNSKFSNFTTNNIISDTINNAKPQEFKKDKNPYSDGEELNLSFILNLLDGILETPGRILIVTSNHPDKLDSAFIRPGRIDVNLMVGYCDINMIIDMFNFFYDTECNHLFDDKGKKIISNKNITPAELNKIILNNYKSPELAYNELIR